jgi:uncharacterized damage-inducible protein DinB
MKQHFQMFATYNRWANRVVYDAAATLDEEEMNRLTGAFFGSLIGTLNHILVADRIWLKRFTGAGDAPTRLDTILHEDFPGLLAARQAEDARLAAYVDSLSEETIAADITYSPLTNPAVITHPLGPALTHMFNHQTHHRGQVHCLLTQFGAKPGATDLPFRQ